MNQIFSQEQLSMLNTPLADHEIESKQGSLYIAGHAAIAKANHIFGPGNWGYTWHSLELHDTGKANKNGNQIFQVSCAVTLEVRGCMPITEIGDCESQGTDAAPMSMARKGAVTDGLKRCLKNYGPAFGLELYARCGKCRGGFMTRKQAEKDGKVFWWTACNAKGCDNHTKAQEVQTFSQE